MSPSACPATPARPRPTWRSPTGTTAPDHAPRAPLRRLSRPPAMAEVPATPSGLAQAPGECLDHARPARSGETRPTRPLTRPEPLKHRALSLVREITAA